MNCLNKSVGGKNRFSFWCDVHQQRVYYGTCLCLLNSYNEKRLNPNERTQDCAIAMQKGNCLAVKMREEEVSAGKSIYFVEQLAQEELTSTKSVDKESDSYKRGWSQVGVALGIDEKIHKSIVEPRKVEVPTKKSEMFTISSMDMGSIISDEVKREKVNLSIANKLKEMKLKIIELSKTDVNAARALLVEAKTLEATMVK